MVYAPQKTYYTKSMYFYAFNALATQKTLKLNWICRFWKIHDFKLKKKQKCVLRGFRLKTEKHDIFATFCFGGVSEVSEEFRRFRRVSEVSEGLGQEVSEEVRKRLVKVKIEFRRFRRFRRKTG